MFEWFPTEEFIARSRDAPFLILIGLRGTYPYVPLQVMRQAGRKQVIPRVDKISHLRADFQNDDSPHKCQSQHMWHYKIVMEKDTIVPNRYHVGCTPFYYGWLEDNWDGLGKPGFVQGHRIIDEKAEAQVKCNQLRKRIRESESEHREIHKSNKKLIEEWKDMAISTNKSLGYFERGIVELEGKFLKKVKDCQKAEGTKGGHLARAYLLLGLRELGKLFEGAKDVEFGEGPSGTK